MGIFHPIIISSDKALIVSVGKEISGTDSLRPLVYNYFQINKLNGNYFILNTIDKKLMILRFINLMIKKTVMDFTKG